MLFHFIYSCFYGLTFLAQNIRVTKGLTAGSAPTAAALVWNSDAGNGTLLGTAPVPAAPGASERAPERSGSAVRRYSLYSSRMLYPNKAMYFWVMMARNIGVSAGAVPFTPARPVGAGAVNDTVQLTSATGWL